MSSEVRGARRARRRGRFGFDARVGTSDGATDTPRDTPHDTSTDTPIDGAALCGGLYCDDFEGAALNARWMVDTFHGTVGLDATRAHSGAQSLHVTTNAIGVATTDPHADVIGYEALPLTGTLYVRAWVYKASPRPTGFFDQTINFADAPGNGISTGAKDGMIANNDYTPPTTYQQSATTMEPVDTWTCWILRDAERHDRPDARVARRHRGPGCKD